MSTMTCSACLGFGAAPPLFETVLAVFAVWRLAQLVAHERGPWDMCSRLHAWAWPRGLGDALSCPQCLSLWLAIVPAAWLAPGPAAGLLLWLAIAGGAGAVERALPAWGAARHDDGDLR
jgi:hypothetical protein